MTENQLKLTTAKQKLFFFFSFFLHRSPPPFPSLTRLLSVVTKSLSLILLETLDSFLIQNCLRRNTSKRSVRPLISSSSLLVRSADFSLKMQPKHVLLPASSHGLITVTVSSWAHPILSSKLSKKFKTLLHDASSWLPISERIGIQSYMHVLQCYKWIRSYLPL